MPAGAPRSHPEREELDVSEELSDRPFPRGALIGAGVLIAATMVAALAGRVGDIGTVRLPPAALVETRDLVFVDRPEGGIAILDADDRSTVAVLAPNTDGFIRGVMRGVARERRSLGIGSEPPVRLAQREDGRLTLIDPQTGREIGLDAFGPTNTQAFARLFDRETTSR